MIKFIRTHDHDLPLPTRGSPESAGLDLCAAEDCIVYPGKVALVSTGWRWDVPGNCGIYGRIAPRSGLAVKHGVDVLAGVVDQDYQGEIKVALTVVVDTPFPVCKGDRIAQLIVEMCVIGPDVFEGHGHGVASIRGAGGFGSTGS